MANGLLSLGPSGTTNYFNAGRHFRLRHNKQALSRTRTSTMKRRTPSRGVAGSLLDNVRKGGVRQGNAFHVGDRLFREIS
jgi:hypothetical protein